MTTRPNATEASEVGKAAASGPASAVLLWARLCLPPQVKVALPVGELSVRPRLTERTTPCAGWPNAHSAGEVLPLEIEHHPGVLLVEGRMALGMVNAVLGLPWPTLGGQLSRIERGVLAGVVAATLARLGLAGRVRLCDGAQARAPMGSFTVDLSVSLAGNDGWACLMTGDDVLRCFWPRTDATDVGAATRLEVARTRVSACELAGAGPGDTLVFDETKARSVTEPWPARLCWRDAAIPVRWMGDGSVVIDERADDVSLVTLVAGKPAGNAGKSPQLAGAWVDVSAALACEWPGSAERSNLIVPRTAPMVLEAEGRAWAYGRLTESDGAMAVIISAMAHC